MDELKQNNILNTKKINLIGKELINHIKLEKSWFNIETLIKIIKSDKKNTGKVSLVFPENDVMFKIIKLEENEIIRLCNSVFKRFL